MLLRAGFERETAARSLTEDRRGAVALPRGGVGGRLEAGSKQRRKSLLYKQDKFEKRKKSNKRH